MFEEFVHCVVVAFQFFLGEEFMDLVVARTTKRHHSMTLVVRGFSLGLLVFVASLWDQMMPGRLDLRTFAEFAGSYHMLRRQ